jgi:hypothetical protein
LYLGKRNEEKVINCSKCGKTLGEDGQDGPVAVICGGIMGDEYIESWYFCAGCQVYTKENYRDRFSGEDDVSGHGPIDKATGDAKVALIQQCPRPRSKRCRCPAHREYFGGWLD